MFEALILFAAFHLFFLQWGNRAYWKQVHDSLGRE